MTTTATRGTASGGASPPLREGERLDQPTFHARYEKMPGNVRAELVGGVVHIVPSPVSKAHVAPFTLVQRWLGIFEEASPGTEAGADGSVFLGSRSEVRPDAYLRILPSHHGSSRDTNDDSFVIGPPELVVEIAVSSADYDLGLKKLDYESAGVAEYVVILPELKEVRWFQLHDRRYEPLNPDADRLFRSQVFPGLWLDPDALLNRDALRLRAAAEQGIASEAHRQWVGELSNRR